MKTKIFGAATLWLLACGPAAAESITWWVPNWDEEAARELVASYEEANPGYDVEIVITTWDTMAQRILTAMSGNNPPDLITELQSRIVLYASRDMLIDVTDWFDRDLAREDFIDSALATGTFDGRLYAVPFRHDGSGLIYNRDMFEDAGLDPEQPPRTWEEFVSFGEALTVEQNNVITQYGTAWPFGNLDNAVVRYLQLLYDGGGTFFNADRTGVELDSPAAIDAMQRLTDTILTNGIAPRSSLEIDNTGLRELFANERIAMFKGGPFDVDPLVDAGMNIGTATLPGTGGIGTTTVDGFSVLIPGRANNPEAAWQFAAFIAQPDSQTRLTATFPANRIAAENERFSAPLLQPFLAQLDEGVPKPSAEGWGEMQRILFDHMQSILLGSATVEDAMMSANEEINALF